MSEKVKTTPISRPVFTADVTGGMSKADLMAKYGISAGTLKSVINTLNEENKTNGTPQLVIKRAVAPRFVLTDDTTVDEHVNMQATFN
jgi:transposase